MKWINVNEQLPKSEAGMKLSIDVLCHIEDGEMIVTYFNYPAGKWELSNNRNAVTHWMPLPPPPNKNN